MNDTLYTKEQKAVVDYRKSIGYSCDDYIYRGERVVMLIKGKHTMMINCLGYDCYTGVQ